MTVDPNSIDLPACMAEHLQRAEPDLLRSMLSTFVQALMSAEADALCGAPYGSARRSGPTPATATGPGGFDTRTGTWVGNLGWTPLGDPLVFLTCLLALAALAFGINHYYNVHYGRVRLLGSQQVRFAVASAACFGIPMILGTILDFRLDLPISAFDVLFGAGMLVWFRLCVGLRPDHLIVWGALIVVGLVPLWGGFDDWHVPARKPTYGSGSSRPPEFKRERAAATTMETEVQR